MANDKKTKKEYKIGTEKKVPYAIRIKASEADTIRDYGGGNLSGGIGKCAELIRGLR